jgi:hypothetical protein
MTIQSKRTLLVSKLRNLPEHMSVHISQRMEEAVELRKKPDLLWVLLLQSAATRGNSRGWDGLFKNAARLKSVMYPALKALGAEAREERLHTAFAEAAIRMPNKKATEMAANFERIEIMGGVEAATLNMLALPTREAKFQFMNRFKGIADKYGRNVWMDIYDPHFRDSIAVDDRLKKVADAIGFHSKNYRTAEDFYCDIALEAGLEPWVVDRLLYNFKDEFLVLLGEKPEQAGGKARRASEKPAC